MCDRMNGDEIYEKVSLKRANGVRIPRYLCFYNPEEVYLGLTRNTEVRKWHEFISNHYVPPRAKILLIYPCSAEKPYHLSRSYKVLFRTLSKLGEKRREIHLVTISEPFGLVPEEFYGKNTPWFDWSSMGYDCPGLFRWWCDKYKQPFNKEYFDKSIEILAEAIADYLRKAKKMNSYSRYIAFVRTYSSNLQIKEDHTHRKIIELASRKAKLNVELHPPKKIVKEIVRKKGRLAWDLYGVSHPIAQEYLLRLLEEAVSYED